MSTTSLPRSEAEAATIRKPLPEDLFVHHDTNAEMRWESVRPDEALTPQDRLFVRNHTETPVIDVESWSLRVHGSGLVAPEGVSLSYADLRALPTTELTTARRGARAGRAPS